jgi:hypothetical protein
MRRVRVVYGGGGAPQRFWQYQVISMHVLQRYQARGWAVSVYQEGLIMKRH